MKRYMIALVRVPGLVAEPVKAFKAVVVGPVFNANGWKMAVQHLLYTRTCIGIVQPACSAQISKYQIQPLHFIELQKLHV